MRSGMLWGTEVCLFRILHDAPPVWESRKVYVCVCARVCTWEISFWYFWARASVCLWFSCLLIMSVNTRTTTRPNQRPKKKKSIYCVWRWNQSAVIFNEVMEATVNSQIDISPWTINKFPMCYGRVWEGQTQQEKCVPGKIVKDGFHARTHTVVIPQHMLGCSAQTDICPLGNLFMLD